MTQGTSPNVSSTCLSLHLLRSHLSYLSLFRRLLLPHLTSPTAASSYLLLSHFVFSIPNPCPLSLLFSLFLLNLRNSATTSLVASGTPKFSFFFALSCSSSRLERKHTRTHICICTNFCVPLLQCTVAAE
ncbi:unnamed protein product [Prunus armeniaca]